MLFPFHIIVMPLEKVLTILPATIGQTGSFNHSTATSLEVKLYSNEL